MKHVLELRGMIAPFTLLKFTNGFRKMETGEIMEIIGTNPDTRKDILAISATLPCELHCVHDGKDRFLIRLRKLTGGEIQLRGEKQNNRPVQAVTP